jgi:hypothetical protein
MERYNLVDNRLTKKYSDLFGVYINDYITFSIH